MEETKTINRVLATGRRKESVASIQLFPGAGQITVNERPFSEYFPQETLRSFIMQPFAITQSQGKYDVIARVAGGGQTGQAGALRHSIARALVEMDAAFRPPLLKSGLLTRDPRMKERKKYGQKGARKRFQWTKR